MRIARGLMMSLARMWSWSITGLPPTRCGKTALTFVSCLGPYLYWGKLFTHSFQIAPAREERLSMQMIAD